MDNVETREEAVKGVESEPDNDDGSEDYDKNTEYADKKGRDGEDDDDDDDDDSNKEVEYDDLKVKFPNPWRLSIMQTLERLKRENDETPVNVLKEPQFSEFVEELQKNVKGCVDQADAFSNESTYKIIMKHFSKLDDHTDGHDRNETLQVAWMDKKMYIKNRLLENIDLFGVDESDDEESINVL
jgi:hypothetical protein